jgi:hypothetical protein
MRLARLALLLVGALACGGCFQLSTVLTVKADGSGAIQQRVLFTSAALAQLRQFAALAGGGPQTFDPFSEQQARAAADALGPGVTYVSSMPINTAEGQGRDITYTFTDINQLRIVAEPPAPGGVAVRPPGDPDAPRVSFQLTTEGDHRLLRITVPRLPFLTPDQSAASSSRPSADQLAMIKPMLAGARLAIVIEPEGELVRTSSPYADGRRVTLIDLAVDQLFKDEATLPRLLAAQNTDDAHAVLDKLPGVKVVLDPEITIEFAP